MADSHLKLIYFDARGRGEPSRLLLAASGKSYEDVRIAYEDYSKCTDKYLLGQMPILEIDGEAYPQSLAHWAFLAKEFGLYGSCNLDEFIIDVVANTLEDAFQQGRTEFYMKAGPERDVALEKLRAKNTPKLLGYLESLLEKNGTGYFVGNSLSLADILVFNARTSYTKILLSFDDVKYPLLKENSDNVLKNERIKAYVDSRKESRF